nr:RecName: Full=Peroxidase 3 [Daucus carota]
CTMLNVLTGTQEGLR